MMVQLFIEELPEPVNRWGIQLQLGDITINTQVHSLVFLEEMLGFIKETRNNPIYRDREIEPGLFRKIPEKTCYLSMYVDNAL
ncbi:MAG: hypothetical protein AAF485_32140, partial [Chloroflexota bacterium]